MALGPHHEAWLSTHPERSPEWLQAKLAEGFDVHHLDGDRGNNDPANVVLIDHLDHMRLHGSGKLNRMAVRRATGKRVPRRRKPPGEDCLIHLSDGRVIARFPYENPVRAIERFHASSLEADIRSNMAVEIMDRLGIPLPPVVSP